MNGCKVGVELECENFKGYRPTREWEVVGEAMLLNGAEFVLRKPLSDNNLRMAVEDLCGGLTKERFTQRCSTHIHVDVSELSHYERMKFITLYTIFEPLILTRINEDRVGNVFCLPISHSVNLEETLIGLATSEITFEDINIGDYKYGSINLASVNRLGSLEFRALHGTGDAQEILEWIDLHTLIKKFSMEFDGTPADMVTLMSVEGATEFCKKVWGDYTDTFKEVDYLMYQGVRNAQYFAFTGRW